MKIPLKDIVEILEITNDLNRGYYNKNDHTLNVIFDEFNNDLEFEDEPEHLIFLPTQYDLNEYDMMEDFILNITDNETRDTLFSAINGRGAFRNFKDSILRFNIHDSWYVHKHKALTRIAQRWCEENGLEYSI